MAAARVFSFPTEEDLLEQASFATQIDSHVVVRETPPWKLRNRWAEIRLRISQERLSQEVYDLQVVENGEHTEGETPVEVPTVKKTWLDEKLDMLKLFICRTFHPLPEYHRGDSYSTCPTCGRKYATPWASTRTAGVIVLDGYISPTTKTEQAQCRNGRFGSC